MKNFTSHINPQIQLFWNLKVRQPKKLHPKITYSFLFASLVAPFFLPETSLYTTPSSFSLPKKVKLKQSYLQLSWFFYMNHLQPNTHKHSKRLRLQIMPCKRKMYTLTKAPMAHKTNSKEQFNFKFYFYKTTFTAQVVDNFRPQTVNESLFFLLLYKTTFPVFETNLFYLKSCSVRLPSTATQFFSYNKL